MAKHPRIDWLKHSSAQEKSGLSPSQYRKLHGITESQWYKARRRHMAANAATISTPVFAQAHVDIPLPPMTLDLGLGVKLVFDRHVESSKLLSVLKALQGLG